MAVIPYQGVLEKIMTNVALIAMVPMATILARKGITP